MYVFVLGRHAYICVSIKTARFALLHCASVASAIKVLCNIGEQFASRTQVPPYRTQHSPPPFTPAQHASRRLMLTVDNEYKMNVSSICEIAVVLYHFVS